SARWKHGNQPLTRPHGVSPMAWNETKLTVVGWINTDITARKLPDGGDVANFQLAAPQRRFDREKQQWVPAGYLYVRVNCFRKLAERTVAALVKGDPVVVTGRAYTSRYEADGRQQSALELEASSIGPDLSLLEFTIERSAHLAAVAA